MTAGLCPLRHRTQPHRPRQATSGRLCDPCALRLAQQLRALPPLWTDLEDVLAGPWHDRATDDPRPLTAAENPLPLRPAVLEHRARIAAVLASWARLAAEEMGQRPPVPDIGRISEWLARRLEWVVEQQWADDLATEIDELHSQAKRLLDEGRRTWLFLGYCLVGDCPAGIYAPDEARTVTCRTCGIEHDVAERRQWLLEHLADINVTTAEAAGLAASYAARPIPESTIRTWVERGRLVQHGKDENGRGLYQLADVLALATSSRQRTA